MARLYTVHSVLRETAVDWPEGVSPDTIVNEAIIVGNHGRWSGDGEISVTPGTA